MALGQMGGQERATPSSAACPWAPPPARVNPSHAGAGRGASAMRNRCGRDRDPVLEGVSPQDLIHPPKLIPRRGHAVEDDGEIHVGVGMGVASSIGAVQDDLDEAVAVDPAQVGGRRFCV
ncbi:MAG TPA: hypothetical protein VHE80_09755 [Acidimicrobiales bacterium]|nr:hypothetical protein [Acidimicrobiales bacterium]